MHTAILEKADSRDFLLRLERSLLFCLLEQRETVKLVTPFDSYHRLLVHKVADYYGFDRIISKNQEGRGDDVQVG